MYKHFVQTNQTGEVIAAFSSAFADSEPGDVLVAETDERHFNLQLTADGVARYIVKASKLVERTTAELDAIAAPIRERAVALGRLAELDKVVSRDVEQLYDDAGIAPTYKPMADAITEKVLLRQQLASL